MGPRVGVLVLGVRRGRGVAASVCSGGCAWVWWVRACGVGAFPLRACSCPAWTGGRAASQGLDRGARFSSGVLVPCLDSGEAAPAFCECGHVRVGLRWVGLRGFVAVVGSARGLRCRPRWGLGLGSRFWVSGGVGGLLLRCFRACGFGAFPLRACSCPAWTGGRAASQGLDRGARFSSGVLVPCLDSGEAAPAFGSVGV